jgi:hypothetical protein
MSSDVSLPMNVSPPASDQRIELTIELVVLERADTPKPEWPVTVVFVRTLPPPKNTAPLFEFWAMRQSVTATLFVMSIPPPRVESEFVLLRIKQRVSVRAVTVPAETAPPASPAKFPVNVQS